MAPEISDRCFAFIVIITKARFYNENFSGSC